MYIRFHVYKSYKALMIITVQRVVTFVNSFFAKLYSTVRL
jgi:hypothetical protein